jgi:hypothetical protein
MILLIDSVDGIDHKDSTRRSLADGVALSERIAIPEHFLFPGHLDAVDCT